MGVNKNKLWNAFWIINYVITAITVINVIEFMEIISFDKLKSLFTLLSDLCPPLISLFIEWVQVPILISILIFVKNQRQKRNWIYLFFLLFLVVVKFVIYVIIAGSVAAGSGH